MVDFEEVKNLMTEVAKEADELDPTLVPHNDATEFFIKILELDLNNK